MFRKIEKLFGLMVVLPPIYMLFRFLKWYIKQDHEPEPLAPESAES